MPTFDLTPADAPRAAREAFARSIDEVRAFASEHLSLARILAGLGFALASVGFGYGLGLRDFRANLPLVAIYAVLAALSHAAGRTPRARGWMGAAWPFVDVGFVFIGQRTALALAANPDALAGWGVGLFVLVVAGSAFTLRARLVLATAVGAILAQVSLVLRTGAGVHVAIGSVLVVVVAAAFSALAVRRMHALSDRLVTEGVAHRLALQRSEELEIANARIAQVAAELERRNQELRVAQREAEAMSSLLVHDMKQPLSSILALVELVTAELSARGDGSSVRDLQVAYGQGERLLAMVADLLAIARLERGALVPKRQRTLAGAILDGVAQAHGRRAQMAGVHLSVRADEQLEGTFDRELIERAIENLLNNALSFVRAGDRIELSAARRGPRLLLAVRNNGPAVPEDVRPHLFERFLARGKARHNAGLGLYFCRLVAEAHGGSIGLLEDPRWPVVFELQLPADAAEDTPPDAPRLG